VEVSRAMDGKKPGRVETLQRLPLFEGLEDVALAKIAAVAEERAFTAGDVLVREGSLGLAVFFIVDGHCEVRHEAAGKVLATLGPGEVFGEMALLDPGPRTASVVALDDVVVYTLSNWHFKPIVEEHPSVALHMLKTLAGRFRRLQAEMLKAHAQAARSG
jgi:CRP/FNR family transcriptional regulator, cyclic AMP receptor protein